MEEDFFSDRTNFDSVVESLRYPQNSKDVLRWQMDHDFLDEFGGLKDRLTCSVGSSLFTEHVFTCELDFLLMAIGDTVSVAGRAEDPYLAHLRGLSHKEC